MMRCWIKQDEEQKVPCGLSNVEVNSEFGGDSSGGVIGELKWSGWEDGVGYEEMEKNVANVGNSLRKFGHDEGKREYGVNRRFGFCLAFFVFVLIGNV